MIAAGGPDSEFRLGFRSFIRPKSGPDESARTSGWPLDASYFGSVTQAAHSIPSISRKVWELHDQEFCHSRWNTSRSFMSCMIISELFFYYEAQQFSLSDNAIEYFPNDLPRAPHTANCCFRLSRIFLHISAPTAHLPLAFDRGGGVNPTSGGASSVLSMPQRALCGNRVAPFGLWSRVKQVSVFMLKYKF